MLRSIFKIGAFVGIILMVAIVGCSNAAIPTQQKAQEDTRKTTSNAEIQPTKNDMLHSNYDVLVEFPTDKYPETARHIQNAIRNGESPVCTIDRHGAAANREKSLAGVPTRKGFDRDEWPMAMCAEGGEGANIEYITPTDNRGAGSWVGNKLHDYKDGTRVMFIVSGGKELLLTNEQIPKVPSESLKSTVPNNSSKHGTQKAKATDNVPYANCTAVKKAGLAPLHRGEPGFSNKLDRDGDGVACEL